MPKFKEATERIFTNVFVCRACKKKIRADPLKVRLGKVKCRKCKSKKLRPKHKEVKGAGGGGTAPAPAKK
jgi:ribosomal protein L40E